MRLRVTLMWSITISYRPFWIVIDATSFLWKEMLYNCTHTDKHWFVQMEGVTYQEPGHLFSLQPELCTGCRWQKGYELLFPQSWDKMCTFVDFLRNGWKVLQTIVIQYHFFDQDLNIGTAFYLSQAGAGQARQLRSPRLSVSVVVY